VSEGRSVFEYIRLERAFAALRSGEASVQHASDLAGYASPANFATAFRRRFGLTPRDAMKSDWTTGGQGSA
jgi:AraC-like DNA-binding protein